MTRVRINVTYKPSVFDPQGATIKDSLHALGHAAVKEVTVGKFFDVELAAPREAVAALVKQMAEELLVNVNMETYQYEIMEED